jgi:hypothetical protein
MCSTRDVRFDISFATYGQALGKRQFQKQISHDWVIVGDANVAHWNEIP